MQESFQSETAWPTSDAEAPKRKISLEDGGGAGTGPEAVGELGMQFDQLKQQVSAYVNASLDEVKVKAKNLFIWVTVFVWGLAIAVGLLIAAVILGCLGLSGAFSYWLDSPAWTGYLMTGALLTGAVIIGFSVFMRRLNRNRLKQRMTTYATR